jgi:hypothetical protein
VSESASSLMRRGLISTKAMNATLAKTKPQNAKMAKFAGKRKDEGEASENRAVSGTKGKHLDGERQAQTAPGITKVTKGGGAQGGTLPIGGPDHIPGAAKFPRGGKMSTAGKKAVGVRGGVNPQSSGPQYGGPSSRANG